MSRLAVLPEPQAHSRIQLGTFRHAEWTNTPMEHPYKVRTKNYLKDKVKAPSAEPTFVVEAADTYHLHGPFSHAATHPESPIHALRKMHPPGTHFWIVHFMFPENYYSLSVYGTSKPGVLDPSTPFGRLYAKFRAPATTDAERNNMLKVIPRIVEGPAVITSFVGEKPALIGNKITTTYHVGEDYTEADIDLGSSMMARGIVNRVVGITESLVVDLGFVLEGHSEEELPEVMMIAFRMVHPAMNKAPWFHGNVGNVVAGNGGSPADKRPSSASFKARDGASSGGGGGDSAASSPGFFSSLFGGGSKPAAS